MRICFPDCPLKRLVDECFTLSQLVFSQPLGSARPGHSQVQPLRSQGDPFPLKTADINPTTSIAAGKSSPINDPSMLGTLTLTVTRCTQRLIGRTPTANYRSSKLVSLCNTGTPSSSKTSCRSRCTRSSNTSSMDNKGSRSSNHWRSISTTRSILTGSFGLVRDSSMERESQRTADT